MPARIFVGLAASIRVAFVGAELAGDLAVGGGEVVVPEERHLLLERALRVHHPEQPALAGVGDVVRRLKAAAAAAVTPTYPGWPMNESTSSGISE